MVAVVYAALLVSVATTLYLDSGDVLKKLPAGAAAFLTLTTFLGGAFVVAVLVALVLVAIQLVRRYLRMRKLRLVGKPASERHSKSNPPDL